MGACVLWRRLPKLHCLPGLRKGSVQAQHVHGKPQEEAEEQEEKTEAPQCQDFSPQGGYWLHYNPSSYLWSARNSALSRSQADNDDDEQCLSTLPPSFWQQSNRYSVSCSRQLSSSKNTLLDLAFSRGPEPRVTASLHHRIPTSPEVKVDTRGFLKCRTEYASMTLDLTERPLPTEWERALRLLQKVTVLKGNMKPSDICSFFVELGNVEPDKVSLVRSDKRFFMLLRYSVENLRLFTQPQLLDVLQSFVRLDMPAVHTVLSLYEAELCARADQMSVHQLLCAADLWRRIGRQVPRFLQHLYESVRLSLGQIGVPELVQLLYIIGEGRHCPKDLIHPIEQLLMRHLQQLYPEEVGTLCLGLFKSQTSITEAAVVRLVEKAHSFVEEMSDFAIVNVLKYLRFSYLCHRPWMEAMTKEVPGRAHRMGVKGLMHVALTCSALHYRNEHILRAIAERVPSLVPHCRSKDSCKLLWAFGTLGFPPVQSPSFYLSLTEALRQKKAEFQRYPEHLLTGLLGLAFVSQFPEDLIALALSPDFVNLALKSTQLELKKDLFTLDGAVRLELPHWTGPRLSCELREEVAEMLWKFAQSDVCQKPEVLEAESALQDLLGGWEFVCNRMILPHCRSIDFEVHLDSACQPIPVNPTSHTATRSPKNSSPKSSANQGWGRINIGVNLTEELIAQLTNAKNATCPATPAPTLKSTSAYIIDPHESETLFDTGLKLTSAIEETLIRPSRRSSASVDSGGVVKLAIQVSNRNHYCYGSQHLLGLHAMKRRQLKLAGYRVIELPYQEWFPMLRKSRAEKLAYLQCKVYNGLQV